MRSIDRDWDNWDVRRALGKRGLSMADLARQNNIAPSTLREVFRKIGYHKGERIVADALDMTPEQIWPSRHAKKTA